MTTHGGRGRAGVAQPWLIVARREMAVKLTDRNFLVSTVLTVLLLAGVFVAQAILAGRESSYAVAVASPEGASLVDTTAKRAAAGSGGLTITTTRYADAAAAEAAVRSGSVDAALERGTDGWSLVTLREANDTLTRELGTTVQQNALATNASAAGTTLDALTKGATLRTATLEGGDPQSALMAKIIGYIFAMLFYFAAIMFGAQIASSVVEEKQSRIVEILATAIPVRQLLLGKIVGNSLLAFGQMALYTGAGVVGLIVTDKFSALPGIGGGIGWFLAFFLAGFVTLACAWAVAGSLASRNEDLQSTTMPLTMVLVVAFMVGFSVTGVARVVCSYIPVISAIVMPSRVIAGETNWWEPLASLLVTLAFAGVVILLGERLYRRSIMQPRRLSLRDAWTARA